MTALKKTADEVGAMDFPAVCELLKYWLEFPPDHELLRAYVGYQPKGRSNWAARQRRAEELDDHIYKPESDKEQEKDVRIKATLVQDVSGRSGARHFTAAPPHIQQAIERVKQGKHMDIEKAN